MERLKVAESPGHRPLPSVVPHADFVDHHIPVALSLQLRSYNLRVTSAQGGISSSWGQHGATLLQQQARALLHRQQHATILPLRPKVQGWNARQRKAECRELKAVTSTIGHFIAESRLCQEAGLQGAHPRMRPAHEAVPLRPVITPGPEPRTALRAAAVQVCAAIPLGRPSVRALGPLTAILRRVLLAVLRME